MIFIPVFIYESNNQEKLTRISTQEIESPEWTYVDQFFALKKEYRPIPVYMYIIGIKNSKTFPNQTESVDIIYDPFSKDYDDGFITWATPVPYTTPLYLYHNSKGMYITFEDQHFNKEFKSNFISPIYVLTKEKREKTIGDSKKWFRLSLDNFPIFKFKEENGRCFPTPFGKHTLEGCNTDIFLNRKKMLSLAEDMQNNDRVREEKETRLYKILTNQRMVYALIFLFFVLLYKYK